MEITEIKECAKNKNRVNLYSNGEFICALYLDTVFENRINKGSVISDDEMQRILSVDREKYALSVALRYLNVRMRTRLEIINRLKKEAFDDSVCDYVTGKLSELGYIDDKQFAELYLDELAGSYGIKMIERKMFEKGISRDIAEELCSTLDEKKNACEYLEKYISKSNYGDDKRRLTQKVFRHMAAKGFLYDDIRYAVKNVIDTDDGIYD